jgi:NAD kinase
MGGDFSDYEREHEVFQQSLSAIQKQLTTVVRNKVIDRSYLPSFIFKGNIPFVLVIGQDGLVANTAKYVGGIPVIAVNPEPKRFDGMLLPFTPADFLEAVEHVMVGKYPARKVALAEVRLNDGQRLLAFNDLFIDAATHVPVFYYAASRRCAGVSRWRFFSQNALMCSTT